MGSKNVTETVDHLFRNEYGKVVALLTKKFGVASVDSIEDAVQEAFIKAMRVWGFKGMPDNPTAWLYRVANNTMIDGYRRQKKWQQKELPSEVKIETQTDEFATEAEIVDGQLKLIFACCDPVLSEEQQLILSLKLMGGFSNRELAEALLKKEEAVAKSFTRAKRKFRDEVALIRFPVEMGLQTRLFVVLRVIYLLFTEGYATTTGTQAIKRDICYEALRLALLLRENTYCQHANLEALIALMCFHASRFEARLDKDGFLVSLEHHDRTKYDQRLITIGKYHLELASTKGQLPSAYHLEAAVSHCHSSATQFTDTKWNDILRLYDLHLQQLFSPMVALNRIVALTKVKGAEIALRELYLLSQKNDFSNSALFFAIEADLLGELQDHRYGAVLEKAISLTRNELVKVHLIRKRRV